jgi:preprotein translocase subunit SecG
MMMSKIYAFIAAAFAILLAWLGIARKQRDKARQETEQQKHARMAEKAQASQTNQIARARQQAQDEAKAVPLEKTTKRPSGNFGSDRL